MEGLKFVPVCRGGQESKRQVEKMGGEVMGFLTGCSSPHGSNGYNASVFHLLIAASAGRLHTWR